MKYRGLPANYKYMEKIAQHVCAYRETKRLIGSSSTVKSYQLVH